MALGTQGHLSVICRETRQELTQKWTRYRWNILGLCEMRWKNFGETTTEEGQSRFSPSSVEKRINTSMALDYLFTRTS